MPFVDDLSEFYDQDEFAEPILINGASSTAMFFEERNLFEGLESKTLYMTMPSNSAVLPTRGDTITRGKKEYRARTPQNHDNAGDVKRFDLEFVRAIP